METVSDLIPGSSFRLLTRKNFYGDIMIGFLQSLDWSPLIITFKTGVVVTAISFFVGLFAAAKLMRARRGIGAAIDGLLTLPMVIPPTVVGFFLLFLFSLRRPLGSFLYESFDIKLVQTWAGCVIAAFIISFPLMYKNARAAFEQVDTDLIDAAMTLGLSDTKIFWRIIVPAARPGIISGTILTFARSIGEYGATSMFAGNIAGKTGTIAQAIAYVIKDGDYTKAGFWVFIVVLISFGVIFIVNIVIAKNYARTWRREKIKRIIVRNAAPAPEL